MDGGLWFQFILMILFGYLALQAFLVMGIFNISFILYAVFTGYNYWTFTGSGGWHYLRKWAGLVK